MSNRDDDGYTSDLPEQEPSTPIRDSSSPSSSGVAPAAGKKMNLGKVIGFLILAVILAVVGKIVWTLATHPKVVTPPSKPAAIQPPATAVAPLPASVTTAPAITPSAVTPPATIPASATTAAPAPTTTAPVTTIPATSSSSALATVPALPSPGATVPALPPSTAIPVPTLTPAPAASVPPANTPAPAASVLPENNPAPSASVIASAHPAVPAGPSGDALSKPPTAAGSSTPVTSTLPNNAAPSAQPMATVPVATNPPLLSPAMGASTASPALPMGDQRLVDALREAVQPINTHLDSLDTKVNALSQGQTDLQQQINALRSSKSTAKVTAPKAPVSSDRPVSSKKPVRSERHNRFEVLSRTPAAQGSSGALTVIHPQGSAVAVDKTDKTPASCQLQAVVEGRAWIKQADGSSQTYGVGDAWTDNATITDISVDKGIKTSRGPVNCSR